MKKRCYVTVLLVLLTLIMPCGRILAAGKADKELKSLIANKKKNGTVIYEVAKGDKVSAQTIKAAKNRPVILALGSNAGLPVSWHFTEYTEECDFDPAIEADVSVPAMEDVLAKGEISENAAYTELAFAHRGVLPGRAEVVMSVSVLNKFKGADLLYLYSFNPETKLFERTDMAIFQGNTVFFHMTSCSENYLIINEKLSSAISDEEPEPEPEPESSEDTETEQPPSESEEPQVSEDNGEKDKKGGNGMLVVIAILLLILAGVIAGVAVFMKKTQF